MKSTDVHRSFAILLNFIGCSLLKIFVAQLQWHPLRIPVKLSFLWPLAHRAHFVWHCVCSLCLVVEAFLAAPHRDYWSLWKLFRITSVHVKLLFASPSVDIVTSGIVTFRSIIINDDRLLRQRSTANTEDKKNTYKGIFWWVGRCKLLHVVRMRILWYFHLIISSWVSIFYVK